MILLSVYTKSVYIIPVFKNFIRDILKIIGKQQIFTISSAVIHIATLKGIDFLCKPKTTRAPDLRRLFIRLNYKLDRDVNAAINIYREGTSSLGVDSIRPAMQVAIYR
jgi:hypothetical protein